MELADALKFMFDVQSQLRTAAAVGSPVIMSKQMYRLSQYTGIVEEKLAEYERDYEVAYAQKLNEFIIKDGMKPSPAATKVDMMMGTEKGQIKYLTRIVGSSWKQVGVCQSRISHLIKESTTNI